MTASPDPITLTAAERAAIHGEMHLLQKDAPACRAASFLVFPRTPNKTMKLAQKFKVKAIQQLAGEKKGDRVHRVTLAMIDVPVSDGAWRIVPPSTAMGMPPGPPPGPGQKPPAPELNISIANPTSAPPFELDAEVELLVSIIVPPESKEK